MSTINVEMLIEECKDIPGVKNKIRKLERARGEWIATLKHSEYCSIPMDIWVECVCSVCGNEAIAADGGFETTTYCPNCGMRMKKRVTKVFK